MAKKKQSVNPNFTMEDVLRAGYRIRPEPEMADVVAPEPEPEKPAGILRTMGDVLIKGAQGVVGLGQSAVGLGNLATGGLVGEGMDALGYDPERTKSIMGQYLSNSQKSSDEKVQQAQGMVDTVAAMIENPRSILGSVAESTPGMLLGGGVASAMAKKIAIGAAAPLGGLTTEAGAAAAKKAVEAAATKLMLAGSATEGAQGAGQIAEQAQREGRSWSEYAAPAAAAGVATSLIGLGAGRLMGDAETALFTGATSAGVKGGLGKRVGKAILSEGVLEEMPQSAQEQAMTNVALGKPWEEGVGQAAGAGLVTGGVMGAGMGVLQRGDSAKPSTSLLADQIRATESVPETGPMTRAANQAVEAKAQQVEMTAGAESAALAAIEQQAQGDLQGLRDFAGRSPDVVAGMPVAGAQSAAPGADPSAEFIDSPFLDRIQTVQEMLADPATREKVRARWGDEGLNNIAYYAGMANRTGLPEKTQDNLLGMAERLLSESVLTPIQPTPELDGMRRDPLTLGSQPQPQAPALGMDATPSGRFTVDPQGTAAPESRVQAMDAQRRAEEASSLGEQTPRGQAQPEATMQGALGIGMDTAPTGRLLAGQDGVRPETRMDAINIGQADMQRQAEAAQRAEMGLTPDIEAVQQRNAMRPLDGDILNPSGKPFKTLMAAQRAAKKNPGQVVEVTGGFAIRPATMVAAQPEVANDGRGDQDAAGLAEALAVSNPEAGDRAATEPTAVTPGEMLDAIPGQPAGDQPAQGDAGQGQRVGREGYDTPIELDAAQLKTILEKTRGEPLATKPAKLEAWRNGTAKTDPNKYPVELAFTTDGRLDVNDGRHRIALAAERGEKVTAFIDGKDAQRAQELLANVQNLPQPTAAQAPADQAPEAARGDGATPAGVPDQGGAAAAVEAAGVEQQPATNAAPENETPPETGGAITADDVSAAEKQAAQMISDRIDGMKAADVQRIAARYLPTVGVKAPMGKARIKAAMTDAAAMNLLGPAGELGIELSESVKRALVAKMEGRVGEASALVAAAAPAPAQPEQQTADQQDDGDGWSSGLYGVAGTQKKYTFSGKPDGHWASVKNPGGQGYDVEYMLGDRKVGGEEVMGSLTAVKSHVSKRVAELDAAQATHKDPGQPAETVTQPVIQAAMKKAARNEDTKPSEMRTWLLGEIDKALQQAPDLADYDATVKRVGEKDAVSMFTGSGLLGKNSETGYVTFDVPGDGTFKVRNSVRGLLEFKRKVAASPGFKDRGQDRVRPGEADSVRRGSGGLVNAFNNMVEDGDLEAASDYADAVGLELDAKKVTGATKVLRWRESRDAAAEKASIDAAMNQSEVGQLAPARPDAGRRADEPQPAAQEQATIPVATADVRADAPAPEPGIAQGRRVSDWPDAVEGWKVVGGGKNAPGYASEKAAKIDIAKNPDWKARDAAILPFRFNDGGVAGLSPYGETSTRYAILIRDVQEMEQATTTEAQADEQADAPKLTQAEAAQLMEWQDMGQKNGVKTHALRFYANQADKDAKRGVMTLITVSKGDVSDKAWTVDGDDQKFGMLAQAKKRGMELGMARAVKDGFVEAGSQDQTPQPAAKATEEKPAGKVENFGEQLPPARRAMAAKLSELLDDDTIAAQPLSKIWPIEENEAIEDTFAAAVAHVMREAIPAKPRKGYKLNGWVEKVKMLREFAARILRGGITKEAFLDQMGKYSTLRDMQSKVKLLEQIDRVDWRRIGEVAERPNALRFENGNSVPSPSVSIAIDGKPHWLRNSGDLNDHMEAIKSMLQSDAPETRMKFEIRQERGGKVFINKAGDKQFHRLLEFDTVAEARKAMDERYADLVSAWDEVKSRENITERDLRTAENRPRTGKDHRNGRDITAEEFQRQFGFRGGEFGKWVSQGKGAQERQFMLNSAYDALMDLADIVGVPPKAISLNGTLGIAFGSRGGGWASAHFEPSNLVINLTKPRGAGALAHEWFHALDNYFARQRNDGKETMPSTFGPGAQDAYRRSNYITHKTGALMVRKDGKGSPVTKARLEEWRKTNPNSGYLDPDQWMLDPKHPQGVRVEVEERFNALVNALDNSPMLQRSRSLEGTRGDNDGYWSRPLERAARAFENYVQHRMHEQGYHNDFLVNVKPAEDTGKNPNRYPYLMPSEMAPIVEAFNDLFGTVETRETEKGVALFASSSAPASAGRGIPLQLAKDVTDKVLDGLGLRGLIAPNVFRNTAEAGISDPASIMPTGGTSAGKIYVFSDNVVDAAEVFKVVFHELFHLGLSQSKLPNGYVQTMLAFLKDPVVRQLANDWKASKDGRSRLGKMPLNNWHALAVEEALAIIGEELSTDKNGIGGKAMTGWVKRTIVWMAGLADKWGLSSVARRLRAMTYTEAEAFVQETMLKGRTGAPVYLPDTRFAQDQGGQNVTFRGAAKDYITPAMDKLNETFNHPGKLSWWHKTVGSMYNLAERMPAFKPVYDAAQNFINDVSFYAIEAADKAPRLLPRLEDWKDLAKSPITAQDNKTVAAPVFEGTLSWRRDESGKPVLVEDLAKRYASLTPEQKAQRLLRANAISENVLKMWQGMPKDQYASSVNTAFEGRMLKAGIVFTPDELKSIFKLNDAQVALYQEFRQSIDASLDNMGKSDLLRVAGKDAADLKDLVMSAPDVDAAAVLLRDHLLELAKENPDRSDALVTTANDMIARAEKVQRLKMEGYAPLSRFGQYTVDVVVDGERQYFSMFETARDANRMAAKLKMEYGAENVAQGTLSQREFEMLQGITPESLELFGNMLGLDSTGNEAQDQVFQEYLKRTKANRSAMKRLIHRKGIAGYSEDVGRVLAAFVYSNARQTSAALHMGDLGEAVMAIPKGEGELKDAAVELARYVKEPREEAAKMRGWLFAQYLGGSIASAIVNFTQPLTTSAPYLSQFGGMGKSVKALYQAMADLKDKQFEADLAESFRKRTEDGTLAPQGVHELMAQSRGEATLRTGDGTQMGDALAKGRNTLAKVMIGWGKLFGMAEQINRQSTYVAAYRMAVERGMADPDAFAKKVVDETQFVNNKANKMKFGRGAIGATLMTFKSYNLNWLELFHRLSTQNGREGKMAAAWMLGVLLLSAGASGLPFAEDAEDLADFLAQRLGYNWSSKKARQQFLEDLFGRDIAGFVENGVTGLPGAPIDVSGRLGMGNMIPGTGLFLSKKDHTSDFTEVLGPAGDLAKRTFQAGDLLLSGNVGQAALMIAPKAIGNLEKGVDMAATGMYRDARGYKVDDATTGEAIGKAIGFQPRAVAQIQEASGLSQRAKDFYRLKVERINAKWAKAIFEKDAATVDEVRAEIKEWNRQNPDQRIQANIPAILRRVKEMRKTKADRIADTAPKALRASMQEEARRMREEQ